MNDSSHKDKTFPICPTKLNFIFTDKTVLGSQKSYHDHPALIKMLSNLSGYILHFVQYGSIEYLFLWINVDIRLRLIYFVFFFFIIIDSRSQKCENGFSCSLNIPTINWSNSIIEYWKHTSTTFIFLYFYYNYISRWEMNNP